MAIHYTSLEEMIIDKIINGEKERIEQERIEKGNLPKEETREELEQNITLTLLKLVSNASTKLKENFEKEERERKEEATVEEIKESLEQTIKTASKLSAILLKLNKIKPNVKEDDKTKTRGKYKLCASEISIMERHIVAEKKAMIERGEVVWPADPIYDEEIEIYDEEIEV
jgi:hypothetical protein